MANSNEITNVQVLGRAARILEAIADHPHPPRLSQIATDTGLHNSSVLRLLQDLQALGYVCKLEDTKRYKLGPQLLKLANTVREPTNAQSN